MTDTFTVSRELEALIAGLAADCPHDPGMWWVVHDWHTDRGLPWGVAEAEELVCRFPDLDGPRWAAARAYEMMPEMEECKGCEGRGYIRKPMGVLKDEVYFASRGCKRCGGNDSRDGSGRVPTSHWQRAELIRLQCELGQLVFPHVDVGSHINQLISVGYPEDHPGVIKWQRVLDLQNQAMALLVLHWSEWSRPLPVTYHLNAHPHATGAFGARFDRGYVSEVHCTLAAFLAHLDALAWCPITTVRLTDREPLDNGGVDAYFQRPPNAANAWTWIEYTGHGTGNDWSIPGALWTAELEPWYDTPELAHAALSTACVALLAQRRKELCDGR